VRLWLRDDERRPDPVPVITDDRTAVLVGLVLWAVALVVVLIVAGALGAALGLWLWTVGVGIVLGLIGLVYLSVTRRRH
jgi:predicted phage tail protein